MPVRILLGLFSLTVCACAAQKLQPATVSSANSTGYALSYPETLHSAADSFTSQSQKAHDLSSKLVRAAPKPKAGEDRALLVQVVEQADADGRREVNVQALRSDRNLRTFWDAERGHIGARVAGAAQKQVTDGGCNNVQTQAAVQQALRESVTRQLQKRTQRTSEAQRYLEQIKPQLSPATWNAAEESAQDITLASYLVYVALVDDVLELQRLRNERDAVVSTLQGALDRERAAAAQSGRANAKAAEASQKRQELIANRLAATHNESLAIDRLLSSYEPRLKQARTEYEQALAGVKASLSPAPQRP